MTDPGRDGRGAGAPIRTLVIGAGGAGSPLAARLAADPAREVVLIEAGPDPDPFPAELRDGGVLRGALPDHSANWAYPAELRPGLPTVAARGRIVGGSLAINGGYFVRATPADFAAWARVGGPEWEYRAMLPLLAALEHDLDFPEPPLHGDRGPMRVARSRVAGGGGPADGPSADRLAADFIAAGLALGHPAEPDKNAGGAPGIGPVPSNIVDGIRISSAAAYLPAVRDRIRIHAGTRALQILLAPDPETGAPRAVGVRTDRGDLLGDEVVLCAGGIATPHLLLLSGIGPREQLAAHGIDCAVDLPVGAALSDHPNLALEWRARPGTIDWDAGTGFPAALNLPAARVDPSLPLHPEGDLEILLAAKPLGFLVAGERPPEERLHLLVAVQQHAGRGRLSLASADPLEPPRIEYRYLESPADRARFRAGVRAAAALLRAEPLAGAFDGLVDLDPGTLASDPELDAWILRHLGTALHTSATAPMGAVVDGAGRVRGVAGLRVADTSILPSAPHRGPANTAVLIGEFIARRILAGD